MFCTLKLTPLFILWMNEKTPVGHVVWPVFAISLLTVLYILIQAFTVYGDIPAVTHPVAFLFSLGVLLFMPPTMAVGYYLLPRLWKCRHDSLQKEQDEAGNSRPKVGWGAFLCLLTAFGFIPLLLFVGLLAALDFAGIDVQGETTRNMLVAGLVVAVLAAERWLKIGWDFMIGGVVLWGGIYVHMNLAKDSLSLWLLFESGIF